MAGRIITADNEQLREVLAGFNALERYMRSAGMEFAGMGGRDTAHWKPADGKQVALLPSDGISSLAVDTFNVPYHQHLGTTAVTTDFPFWVSRIKIAPDATNDEAALLADSIVWEPYHGRARRFMRLDLLAEVSRFILVSSDIEEEQ